MKESQTAAAEAQPKKKSHVLRNILLVLLGIIVALAIFICVTASANKKHMDKCAEYAKTQISGRGHLTMPVDCSEFENLKVYGIMKFDTQQFDVEGLGNLCIMRANAGVMQMLTFTLTPAKKDMPLLSVDYMYMLGNRTAYVEVYDLGITNDEAYQKTIQQLQAVGEKYADLTDTVPTPAWYDDIRPAGSYKKTKKADDGRILDMMLDYVNVYMDNADAMEALPEEQIPEKLDAMEGYTHRLISEGGVSTDVFKKELGEERTTRFFDEVMFGTAKYRN